MQLTLRPFRADDYPMISAVRTAAMPEYPVSADELSDADLRDSQPTEAFEAVVAVSVLDDESLDRLRAAIWGLMDLIRVRPRRDGRVDEEPFALPVGATVAELAERIHHDVGRACTGGRVWGPSARFDGQRVGRGHVLADGDVVEVLVR